MLLLVLAHLVKIAYTLEAIIFHNIGFQIVECVFPPLKAHWFSFMVSFIVCFF